MDQKERDTQRALGHMEEFRVEVMVPIKVNVRMTYNVEAVSEEDAIASASPHRDATTGSDSVTRSVYTPGRLKTSVGEIRYCSLHGSASSSGVTRKMNTP